jgi:hypothetical protein
VADSAGLLKPSTAASSEKNEETSKYSSCSAEVEAGNCFSKLINETGATIGFSADDKFPVGFVLTDEEAAPEGTAVASDYENPSPDDLPVLASSIFPLHLGNLFDFKGFFIASGNCSNMYLNASSLPLDKAAT